TSGERRGFEIAHQAWAVSRVDPRGRFRIELAQTGVHCLGRFALEPRAERRVVRQRREVEPVEDRAHVEPGPADQDGDASATADIVERGARVALVAIDVVTLARLDHVDEGMATARALFARWLRAAD